MVVLNRKGQALQFNFILGKGGFSYHPDGTFSVDYTKVCLISMEDCAGWIFHKLVEV